MVEEYRVRHERVSEQELLPISPGTARAARERRVRPPRFGRGWLIGAVVLALIVALAFLGRSASDDEPESEAVRAPVTTSTSTAARARTPTPARKPPVARTARLQILPSAQVYVCLVAAGGRRVLDGALLDGDSPRPVYRSRSFRLTLGNGSAVLRINGKRRQIPEVTDGIGYRITPRGVSRLSPAARPACSS